MTMTSQPPDTTHNGANGHNAARQPPHDADAERAVLGVCLLGASTLVDEARRHLPDKPNPFYNNRHARIWEAITALADANVTPEPIAVADRARTVSGTWKDPDDAIYLASLLERAQAGVDTHMVAGHARIIARHAAARTILERTVRIQHLARELSTDDPETLAAVLADLQADVDAVVAAAPARPKPRLEFLSVRELSDRVAAAGPRTWLLRGLWPNGDYGVHAAEPKAGKAQPLTAPVATPTGWTTIGALVPGDTILGADGRAQKVEAVYDQGQREVWSVETGDGTAVECCGEHLWAVTEHNDRVRRPGQVQVVTTEHLAETVRTGFRGRVRWQLPQPAPALYEDPAAVPVDPYLLGLLLGDGGLTNCVTFSSGDPELLTAFASLLPDHVTARRQDAVTVRASGPAGNQPNPLTVALRELGLMGHGAWGKFIPAPYQRRPVTDRLALLQGLMDTDGGMERRRATFSTVSPWLADGVCELVRGLGGTARPKWRTTKCNGKPGRRSCRITVRLPLSMNPFRLARKADAYASGHATRREPSQRIVAVRRTGRAVPMRCIAVSNPDRLYRTTGHVLTHNTFNTCDLAVAVSTGSPWLGHVEVDTQGHVLMLAGEGGEIDLHQRLTGVAAQFAYDLNDLPITVCPRAPHITNPADMRQVRDAIERTQPALVTLDPLYLAARGANMASLYEMGAALEEIQHVCQDAGSSLWVATHFNRKEGKGQQRITGAGPAEWGRVLSTATIVSRKEDRETKETTVISEMAWVGGSIADHTMRVVRRIRRVVPDDINSPYVYSVEIENPGPDASTDDNAVAEKLADMAPAGIKLYEALKAIGKPSTSRQIVDQVAKMHGHGLARPTSSKHLNILADAKLVDRVDRGQGVEALWCMAGQGDQLLISDGDT